MAELKDPIKRVLLFRTPKDDGNDKFEKVLREKNFLPSSIPVLAFSFIHLEELGARLEHTDQYTAVVFTSQNAVEAALQALALTEADNSGAKGKKRKRSVNMKCYVVGESTCNAATQAGFCPQYDGSQCGNADKLAEYIISDLKEKDKPILYPCGNLRRDTLSTKLKLAGYNLEELVVYETGKSSHIQQDVESFIQQKGLPDFIVYFSPSGVQHTADLVTNGLLPVRDLKVIAIGPTTMKELTERNIPVYNTAESPDPQGLVNALLSPHTTNSYDT